jgi:hypothetical protein
MRYGRLREPYLPRWMHERITHGRLRGPYLPRWMHEQPMR